MRGVEEQQRGGGRVLLQHPQRLVPEEVLLVRRAHQLHRRAGRRRVGLPQVLDLRAAAVLVRDLGPKVVLVRPVVERAEVAPALRGVLGRRHPLHVGQQDR